MKWVSLLLLGATLIDGVAEVQQGRADTYRSLVRQANLATMENVLRMEEISAQINYAAWGEVRQAVGRECPFWDRLHAIDYVWWSREHIRWRVQ